MVIELEEIAPLVVESRDELLRFEVEKVAKKLKPQKAPDTDGITGEILQAIGEDVVVEKLFEICNQTWIIPEEWTKSIIIVAMPKKGDLGIYNNYLTLSLINHMCKVSLMIILERLKTYVEPYLSEKQAGFRRDRSTV